MYSLLTKGAVISPVTAVGTTSIVKEDEGDVL